MSRFRSNSVRLSPQHGINPSIMQCFYCLEDKGLAFCGRMPDDKEAPRRAVFDREPCDNCKAIMAQGIILISAKPDTDPKSPYRTGGWVAVKDEAFRRIFSGPEAEQAIQARVCLVDDETWDAIGLPRGKLEGVPSSTAEFRAQQEQAGGDSPSTDPTGS